MIKVKEPTIQDDFSKAILQGTILKGTPKRQEEIVLSRIRLALLQGYPTSVDENGRVQFELAKSHLDNAYISKLPLQIIKAGFNVLAEKAKISAAEIDSVMIVKQPGFLRDKVIVHMPGELFMQKITASLKDANLVSGNKDISTFAEISPRMN